jgi:hypothetical protein
MNARKESRAISKELNDTVCCFERVYAATAAVVALAAAVMIF